MFYTTVIPRVVNGIRVVGSYAWATFNANGETVREEVYWPDLRAAVFDEAAAVRGTLQGATAGQRFLARLPADAAGKPYEVVVRHTEHYAFSKSFSVAAEVHVGEHRYKSALDGTEAAATYEAGWPQLASTSKP